MTRIKICGLRTKEDAKMVNDVLPEYAGMILSKPYRRFVPIEQAKEIREALNPAIALVGVFVNEPIEYVNSFFEQGIIDFAQLHGEESEEYIKTLQRKTKKSCIKAFRITSEEDVQKAAESTADYVLLDAGYGEGKTFDWNVFQKLDRPFFLAGGLNKENVKTAIAHFHPYAVDVSSGVETNGVKDKEKTEAFAACIRNKSEKR